MGLYVRFEGYTDIDFNYDIRIYTHPRDGFGDPAVDSKKNIQFRKRISDPFFDISNIPSINTHFVLLGTDFIDNTQVFFNGFRTTAQYRAGIVVSMGVSTFSAVLSSTLTTPFALADEPINVGFCGSDSTYARDQILRRGPCNILESGLGVIRVYWETNASTLAAIGYDPNFMPTNQYFIEYFRVEVFSNANCDCLLVNITCSMGQTDGSCDFDQKIARITALPQIENHYIRVVSGTIIRDGKFSPLVVSNATHIKYNNYTILHIACPACPAGSYKSALGLDQCKLCAEGKCQTSMQSLFCNDCIIGKFSNSSGNVNHSDCTSCPVNSNNYNSSSTREDSCKCNKGSSRAQGGSDCTLCPEGKYQMNTASFSCIDCLAGKYIDSFGNDAESKCKTCSLDSNNNIAASPSCECNKGYFSSNGRPTCTKCPKGKYQTQNGLVLCIACTVGKYLDTSGNYAESDCNACPPNSNNSSEASSSCMCDKGFSSYNSNPVCMMCSQGKYQENAGSSSCTDCAAGKYLDSIGNDEESDCKACPANINTSNPASTSQQNCTYESDKEYAVIITFKSSLDRSQITTEMETNIRGEISKRLDIDISRIGLLSFAKYQFEKKVSFEIALMSREESNRIENVISFDMLNSILSDALGSVLIASDFEVHNIQNNGNEKPRDLLDVLIIIVISAGGLSFVIIVTVIACLCNKRGKSPQLNDKLGGTAYCVICSKFDQENAFLSSKCAYVGLIGKVYYQ